MQLIARLDHIALLIDRQELVGVDGLDVVRLVRRNPL